MDTKTPKAPRSVAVPAHAGWRLISLLYDLLPVIALLFVISALFLWLNGGRTIEASPVLQWMDSLVSWLLVGSYFVVSWRHGGQTIGMRPWRLRLVTPSGRPPRTHALWLRYLVATATLGLGFFWAFFDRDKRALYDIAAGTVFVRMMPKQRQPRTA